MKNTRPLVSVATVCEKVLTEKDNVLSCIRLVDIFRMPPEAQSQPDVALPVSALIALKAGDFLGEGELSLVVETPDGTRNEVPTKWPLLFDGPLAGANVNFAFGIYIRHLGTTWVEVLWNGDLLTKFPVKLELLPNEVGQQN
jgi:hypothetical protein